MTTAVESIRKDKEKSYRMSLLDAETEEMRTMARGEASACDECLFMIEDKGMDNGEVLKALRSLEKEAFTAAKNYNRPKNERDYRFGRTVGFQGCISAVEQLS